MRVRLHDRHLGARPVEHRCADRMPLAGVGVEQAVGRVPVHGGRELPAEVHGVAEAEVESLAAERGVDVRGVAGEQHASLPVGRRLHRAIGEGRGEMDLGQCHVGAGDTAQHRLEMLAGRLLRAIERAAVEVHHADVPSTGIRRYMPVGVRLNPRRSFSGSAMVTCMT